MFYCYKVTCTKTMKSYVGMTGQTINSRFLSHARDARRGSPLAFHRALMKHGPEFFWVSELSRHRSQEEALDAEARHIKELGTLLPSGYNMTPGGSGVLCMAEESREKHRNSIIEKHKDPKFKARHIQGVKDSFTPERRKQISESKKGLRMHPNAVKGIMEAKKTPEYRRIAREAAKATWAKEGYRESWRESKKKKHIQSAEKFPARRDGLVFASTRDAANYMRKQGHEKAAPNNICLACNGKYKSSCGHEWKWVDGDEARKNGGIIVESE